MYITGLNRSSTAPSLVCPIRYVSFAGLRRGVYCFCMSRSIPKSNTFQTVRLMFNHPFFYGIIKRSSLQLHYRQPIPFGSSLALDVLQEIVVVPPDIRHWHCYFGKKCGRFANFSKQKRKSWLPARRPASVWQLFGAFNHLINQGRLDFQP